MKTNRFLERLTFLALVTLLASSFYYWDFVHQAFRRTHNTLGETNLQVPTSDLFLWSAVAVILYFGTRIWSYLAPKVFLLSPESAAAWRRRLQLARVASTFTLLGLNIRHIHNYVPDFIDKLPWP